MGANSVVQRVQLRAPETDARAFCNDNCQISAIPRVIYSINIIKGKTSTELNIVQISLQHVAVTQKM